MRGHDGIAIQGNGHHGKAGGAMRSVIHLADFDFGNSGGRGAQQQGGKKQSGELFHGKTPLLK